jgi:hypothetical protein
VLEFYIVVLIVGSIAGITTGIRRRNAIKRRIRTGSFTFAHDTAVTVVGTIRPTNDLVESPLSARRGVYVYAEAELPEPGPDFERMKLTTIRMIPFELDTQHGVILVDGDTADITMKPVAPRPRVAELEREFITAHERGVETASVATFREVVLAPGARITVYGVAKIEALPDAERGYRDAVPTRARIIALAKEPITIGEPSDRY